MSYTYDTFVPVAMPGTLKLSSKQAKILDLLTSMGDSYGLELVKSSDGTLKRGTVYVTLDRMEDRGLVESWLEDAPAGEQGPQRRKYRPTGQGETALAVFLSTLTATFAGIRAAGFALPMMTKEARFAWKLLGAGVFLIVLFLTDKLCKRRPLMWVKPLAKIDWLELIIGKTYIIMFIVSLIVTFFRDLHPEDLVRVNGVDGDDSNRTWLTSSKSSDLSKGLLFTESFDEMMWVRDGAPPIRFQLKGVATASSVVKPAPGASLMQALRALRGKKYVDRVLEPVYMDFWHEYAEALSEGDLVRARWIRVRFYWDFARTAGLLSAVRSVGHFVKEIMSVFRMTS